MTEFEDKLSTLLYRVDCPSTTDLGDYQLGMISSEQAKLIRKHLEICPHCRREVNQLEGYLQDLSSDFRVDPLSQLRVVIGRLLKSGSTPGKFADGAMVPALAGVRGSAEEPRVYQAEDIKIAIEVKEDGENIGHFALTGLINKMEWAGSQVNLRDSEELIAETFVGAAGEFIFSEIASGAYSLVIISSKTEIHLDIDVG
jgi:hypothetical protein